MGPPRAKDGGGSVAASGAVGTTRYGSGARATYNRRLDIGEKSLATRKPQLDSAKLDRIVAEARRSQATREQGYRERALKMYPWICGRCMREFTQANVSQLTVHHRDHNHDNNPPDGSNWELLCTYCHENEHQRQVYASGAGAPAPGGDRQPQASYRPFADLDALLKKK